jgi:hypothetical protein
VPGKGGEGGPQERGEGKGGRLPPYRRLRAASGSLEHAAPEGNACTGDLYVRAQEHEIRLALSVLAPEKRIMNLALSQDVEPGQHASQHSGDV